MAKIPKALKKAVPKILKEEVEDWAPIGTSLLAALATKGASTKQLATTMGVNQALNADMGAIGKARKKPIKSGKEAIDRQVRVQDRVAKQVVGLIKAEVAEKKKERAFKTKALTPKKIKA